MRFQCPQCSRVFELPDHAYRVRCPCGYQGQFAETPAETQLNPKAAARAERATRVNERVTAQKRLIRALKFVRGESETGLGDTVARLLKAACGTPERAISQKLFSFVSQCGCDRDQALEKMNTEHPYT